MTILTALWAFIRGSWLGRAVAIAGAVLLALWVAYVRGKSEGAETEAARRDAATARKAKEMRDAGNAVDRSPDGIVDRLRNGGF